MEQIFVARDRAFRHIGKPLTHFDRKDKRMRECGEPRIDLARNVVIVAALP